MRNFFGIFLLMFIFNLKLYLCALKYKARNNNMQYTLLAKDKNSEARCGVLTTAHGEIHTPVFMPVGTVGSVKAVHMRELKEDIRAEIILGNNFRLKVKG